MIGSAYVRGLESAGVVATLKHFAGYSASRGGRNLAPVSAGPRELADVLLPPFEMALRAGARSVMNSYCDIDGVPVAADPSLLTGRLRGDYGFTGTVVSDYFSVGFLHSQHAVAGTRADAAELALRAGIDVELPAVDCFGEPLREAVEAGLVEEALVDRAAGRVLRQKCELGLLDEGWAPGPEPAGAEGLDLDDEPSRALAREVARRSIVLLQQRRHAAAARRGADRGGRAPGRRGQRDARAATRSRSMSARSIRRPRWASRCRPCWPRCGTTRPAYDISYAQGCPVLGGDDAGLAEAAAAAAARRTSAWPCSATWPACSAGAPPARAATRPACGCPAASRNCWRRCWAPARRWSSCCWWGARTS